MLIFEIRLPLKERLVATSDKTRALTSRISAVSQVMKIPKSTKKKKNSLATLVRFCFRIIASKMLIFEVCLLLKKLLVTTLIETREFTSRNNEVN